MPAWRSTGQLAENECLPGALKMSVLFALKEQEEFWNTDNGSCSKQCVPMAASRRAAVFQKVRARVQCGERDGRPLKGGSCLA